MNRRELIALLGAGSLVSVTGCGSKSQVGAAADLLTIDAIGQAELVANGELTALELTEAAIARIERCNAELNAVVSTDFERALARANTARGNLAGVPYLLKDLNAYVGLRFTRGSRLFLDDVAATQTSYTDKIENAGLNVLGKTNTPEFGLLPSTEPAALGAARNPWNTAHSTGGSSGGSAAAVAARLVPAAQASDGGGSIRIPASQCGVLGLKPSRGRFPEQGNAARTWPISIKHAVSVSVRDSALILALTEQESGGELPATGFVLPAALKPLRIAMTLGDADGNAPDPAVAAAVRGAAELLHALGHDVVETDATPLRTEQFAEHFLALWAESAAGVAAFVEQQTGSPAHESGLLESWTLGLADHYAALPKGTMTDAIRTFQRAEQATAAFFDRYDAWLTPVTATPAPTLGYMAPDVAFDRLFERVSRFAAYTPLHNVAGTPAISIPFARTADELPIGVQLSTRHGGERLLLELAYLFEESHPWHEQLPAVHG